MTAIYLILAIFGLLCIWVAFCKPRWRYHEIECGRYRVSFWYRSSDFTDTPNVRVGDVTARTFSAATSSFEGEIIQIGVYDPELASPFEPEADE